jgi:RNase adaptor protein for sRNA GlmZ degradation
MKAILSSETLVTAYKTTRRHNPEDHNRHTYKDIKQEINILSQL